MSAEPPDFEAARDHVLREVVRFARRLRADGASVPINAAISAVEALVAVGLDDRDRVRAATYATLVRDPRDDEVFEAHFGEFWYRLRTGIEATATVDDVGERSDDGRTGGPEVGGETTAAMLGAVPEGTGNLSDIDVDPAVRSRRVAGSEETGESTNRAAGDRSGTFSPAGEGTAIEGGAVASGRIDRGLVRRFVESLATLSGRRWTRSRAGDAVDARRALRESLNTGGVAMTLPTRRRHRSTVRACVLVDVSRSVLDAVDREFLLSFVDSLVAHGPSVEVFFFDTDVREVTDAFGGGPDDPLAALERAEVDWGGGTRIGASLATLRRRWPHAVDRRTATLVVSDGFDVGDPDELETGMARLARRSGCLLWLNPLAASPAYEPSCRGMSIALSYVDGLFAFAGVDDVREIARQLERRDPKDAVGYEHDFRDRGGVSS